MNRKKIKMLGMADWFSPLPLARTGVDVVISTIFGRHADRRLLEALADDGGLREKQYYDFSDLDGDEDFWFDYIADVGDGFNSTYTMAHHLSRPELNFDSPVNGEPAYETKPGKILVLGGDEVYPVAGRKAYQDRLVKLYNAALPEKDIEPDPGIPAVFAIPGNHDWYDSLVTFSEVFCDQRKFAGWRTMQNRSYFALKLPRGWWLFGTDMQLGSALDRPQMEYFSELMKNQVGENDQIILCNAEPHWLKAKLHENDPKFSDRNMGFFEGHTLKRRVAIFIAGDIHYYRRHEEVGKDGRPIDNPKQKITAGGGGAFLHPTHNQNVGEVGKTPVYKLRKTFPDERDSRRLCWWNLLFPIWNPFFGVVTGLIYLLTAKAFFSDLGAIKPQDISQALMTVFRDALITPMAIFWVIIILGGFVLFTGARPWPYRLSAGLTHAISHLLAVFFISWLAAYWLSGGHGIGTNSIGLLALVGLLIFAGGWIVGSFIFGFYLFISLNIFGRHANEAFSALKIADYKNFVRFRIRENGDLQIFPVGVRRVQKWRENTSRGEPRFSPSVEPGKENRPELIEPPTTFKNPFPATKTQAPTPASNWRQRIKPIKKENE